jgi:cell division protein FtsI (penicillin-binding protein 3)
MRTPRRPQASTHQRLRLRLTLVGMAFIAGLAAIAGRAVYLQAYQGPELARRASEQYEKNIQLTGKRGTIFDTRLREMAVSVETTSIGAFPARIPDPAAAAAQLSKVLKVDRQALAASLKSKKPFVWVKRQAAPKDVAAVRQLALPGLEFLPEHNRYYPNRMLAAQVIGFTGVDGKGLDGLEHVYNQVLSGEQRSFKILRDAFGRGFEGRDDLGPPAGDNLVLTIDRTVQHIAEKALKAAVDGSEAQSGIAVVLVPQSGAVLAMAHYPFFNPNSFKSFGTDLRRNRAVTDAFEPGSTLKLFSAAAALEAGIAGPQTIFYCENGAYRIGRETVHDTKPHGWLSLQRIVKVSSNIGAIKVGEMMGSKVLHQALADFGFGTRTGIDCPGETPGSLAPVAKWTRFDLAAASFGHGMSVSALQLTAATAAIANGGRLMRPYVVQAVTDFQGREIRRNAPTFVRTVVSPATAAAITEMMAMVVTEGGTGQAAALDGYTAGGKTGTAQKAAPGGGYDGKAFVSSFVGFAPLEKPALAILVVLDEPRKKYYGGEVAAPAFREIAQQALNYLNVPPGKTGPDLTVSRRSEVTG